MLTPRRPVADNKQAINRNYFSEHRNRRVPVPGRQEARDFIPNGSPAGLSRRAKKPARFYRSSYKQRTTREDGYCFFWTWDDRIPGSPPRVTATPQQFKQSTIHPNYSVSMATLLLRPPSYGHCCHSSTTPSRSANGCRRRRDDCRDDRQTTQSSPTTRPTSQLSTITRSTPTKTRACCCLVAAADTTRRSSTAVTDTNASANSREYN
jgi:hypothetical protein